jgi:RHS repeat-associated protein
VVKRIDYDSFGNIINDTDPAFEIPFAFAGGLHDKGTGLVRFGYRDYDPDIARWCAKDPILFAGGDTDLYGYCLNDPVNIVDPEGKLWVPFGGNEKIEGEIKSELDKVAPPGTFSEGDKNKIARELRKELTLDEGLKLRKSTPEEAEKILKDVFNRIKKKIERSASLEDKELLKKIEKLLKDQHNACP